MGHTDAPDAAGKGRGDNLVAGRICRASNIHGKALRVAGGTRPFLGFLPRHGSVGTIQHQGDARRFPNCVQQFKEGRVHVGNLASWRTPAELGRREILTHPRPPPRASRPDRGLL